MIDTSPASGTFTCVQKTSLQLCEARWVEILIHANRTLRQRAVTSYPKLPPRTPDLQVSHNDRHLMRMRSRHAESHVGRIQRQNDLQLKVCVQRPSLVINIGRQNVDELADARIG